MIGEDVIARAPFTDIRFTTVVVVKMKKDQELHFLCFLGSASK